MLSLDESKIIKRQGVSFSQAKELMNCEKEEEILEIMAAARRITRHLHGNHVDLCGIVNAKSGLCPEDCTFCAQSVQYQTGVKRYPILDSEPIIERAKNAKKQGAEEFCIVTSGRSLTRQEFSKLLAVLKAVRHSVDIRLAVSVGFLTYPEAYHLKMAGVKRINHNLQTSSSFYGRVVTTHSYDLRIQTLEAVKQAGLEICCGVILGVGENREDRLQAAFGIKRFDPKCVPVNLLDPRPGTPLEKQPPMKLSDILKTIAVFRLIFPKTCLKLAGGRQVQLGESQRLALQCGINGLIIGEYLTTPGSSIAQDFKNLQTLNDINDEDKL